MSKAIALIAIRGMGNEVKDNGFVPLLGKPLIDYPIYAAKHAEFIDRVYLTSCSEKLCDYARTKGVHPLPRPQYLSKPSSSHHDVISYAMKEVAEIEGDLEFLVVMLGNVATYEVGIVDKCLSVLKKNPQVDTVVTVVEQNEFHPLRAKRLRLPVATRGQPVNFPAGSARYIESYLDVTGKVSTNRQDLESAYFLNFSVMALRVDTCMKGHGQWPHGFCGKVVVGVNSDHCEDIFNQEDIAFTEAWLINHNHPSVRNLEVDK